MNINQVIDHLLATGQNISKADLRAVVEVVDPQASFP